MIRRSFLAIATAVAALLAFAAPVGAQEVVVPGDAQTGWDHVGPPPDGAFSSADWCFSFRDPSLIGETVTVTATGPGGTVVGVGTVGDDASVRVRVGITEGGGYTVTSIVATPSGRSISAATVESVTVAFDPPFLDCAEGLSLFPATTTTVAVTTSSTASTTSTTVAPATSQPVASSSTTSSSTTSSSTTTTTSASTPEAASPGQSESGGGSNLPLLLIVVGLLLLFMGAAIRQFPGLAVASTTRCEREKREVARLTTELKRAEAAEKAKREESTRLKGDIEKLRFKRTNNPQKREMDERALMKKRAGVDQEANLLHAQVRTARELLAKAQAALDACLKRGGTSGPTSPGATSGGEGGGTAPPSTAPQPKKHPDCCPSGNWIGLNVYTGGIIFGGVESGVITLFCMEDPSRMAVLKWSGTRLGIALGGEASAGLFIVMGGGVHPADLPKTVAGILKGIDADLTIGVSWSKLLKGMGKAGRSLEKWKQLEKSVTAARDSAKAISKAKGAGKTVEAARISRANAETIKELIRDGAADDIAEAAIKGTSSGVQAGGTGVNIPYGKGLQAGFWYLFEPNVVLIDLDGCKNCDPSK